MKIQDTPILMIASREKSHSPGQRRCIPYLVYSSCRPTQALTATKMALKLVAALAMLVALVVLQQHAVDAQPGSPNIFQLPPTKKCQKYCMRSCANGVCTCVAGCEKPLFIKPCLHCCMLRKCCKCACALNGDAVCTAYKAHICH
ncbi:hypothetical protein LSAT2_022248 [Lamellibrachia satsuma]|nr:hypothetical protein LSAT2_022248 [Lamellibrachia satsuma]